MKQINNFIYESLTKDKEVSKQLKNKEFNNQEIRFIDIIVGDKWYCVNKNDSNYDKIDFIVKDLKQTAKFNQEKTGHQYIGYLDDDKNIHIVRMEEYKTGKPIKYIVAPNTIK